MGVLKVIPISLFLDSPPILSETFLFESTVSHSQPRKLTSKEQTPPLLETLKLFSIVGQLLTIRRPFVFCYELLKVCPPKIRHHVPQLVIKILSVLLLEFFVLKDPEV